jgi:hypothetical protein
LEVSGQVHASAALPRGKSPRYPLNRGLGGAQNRSGRCGEGKILAPCQDSNSNPLVILPVASRYTGSSPSTILPYIPLHSSSYSVPINVDNDVMTIQATETESNGLVPLHVPSIQSFAYLSQVIKIYGHVLCQPSKFICMNKIQGSALEFVSNEKSTKSGFLFCFLEVSVLLQ